MINVGTKQINLYAVILLFISNAYTGLTVKTNHAHFENKHTHRRDVAFSFAKLFNNHMVLQKAPAKSNIYGFSSDVGAAVTVTVTVEEGKTTNYQTTVKQGSIAGAGQWIVTLDPENTGTSVTISAQSGGTNITLSDVIFGDVWLCSGQSNMEFTVSQMIGSAAEVSDAKNYPNIRLMTVNNDASDIPVDDLLRDPQAWTRATEVNAVNYFSAVCWVYGKAIHKALGYPIGLVDTDWGGTYAEAWSSPAALAKCGVHRKRFSDEQSRRILAAGPNDNSALWNSMIYPLLKMTIFGAVWYQGEQDSSGDRMDRYNCTFPAMINDWRGNFHSASGGQTNATFPFGFVQLAPNGKNENSVGFPDIRWHQTADYGYVPNPLMTNVFMAVTMDLPDFDSTFGAIHPRDKLDVGLRLSLGGLAVAYGKSEVFQGPFPQKVETTAQGMMVEYGDKWNLEYRNKAGFELQCNYDNNNWVATEVIASDKTSVTLKIGVCPQGQSVSGVRYEWRESPCDVKLCAVYETVNGLPAPPFVLTGAASG